MRIILIFEIEIYERRGGMAHYQTKSRKQILEFMDCNPDQSYTADALAEALAKRYGADAPGKSTVYRLVAKMAEEQLLHKSEQQGTRSSLYRKAGAHCHEHLHLKCLDCGKLMHMEEEQSALLLKEIFKQNGFTVDEYRSVLFGRCGCQKDGGEQV